MFFLHLYLFFFLHTHIQDLLNKPQEEEKDMCSLIKFYNLSCAIFSFNCKNVETNVTDRACETLCIYWRMYRYM